MQRTEKKKVRLTLHLLVGGGGGILAIEGTLDDFVGLTKILITAAV